MMWKTHGRPDDISSDKAFAALRQLAARQQIPEPADGAEWMARIAAGESARAVPKSDMNRVSRTKTAPAIL